MRKREMMRREKKTKYVVQPIELIMSQKVSILDALKTDGGFTEYDKELLNYFYRNFIATREVVNAEIEIDSSTLIKNLFDEMVNSFIEERSSAERYDVHTTEDTDGNLLLVIGDEFWLNAYSEGYPRVEDAERALSSFVSRNDSYIWALG